MEDKEFYPEKVWNLAIHTSISCFISCFTITSMNSCTENIGVTLGWGDSVLMISIFTTMFPIGSILGSFIGAPISKKYGAVRTLTIFNVVNILGCIMCVIPTSFTFGLGRFITGVVGGLFVVVPAVLINEMTPDAMTGQVGTVVQQAFSLSLVSSYSLGLIVPTTDLHTDPRNYLWMLIMLTPALASLYQMIFFWRLGCESPGWLISQGRVDDAKDVLRYVYSEKGIDRGMKRLNVHSKESDVRSDQLTEPLLEIKDPTYKQLFCSKKYRKLMRITLALNIGQQSSGSIALFLYSTTMFGEMGGGIFMARVLTVLMGVVTLIFGLIAIPMIQRFGRKTLLMSGQFLISLDLFALGATTGFIDTSIIVRAVLVYAYFAFFSFSLGSTFWAYIGEVCNAKCVSIGMTINSLSIVIISFGYPVALNALGIANCFFIFSGLAFILLIYEMVEIFETKGLTKHEIQRKVLN